MNLGFSTQVDNGKLALLLAFFVLVTLINSEYAFAHNTNSENNSIGTWTKILKTIPEDATPAQKFAIEKQSYDLVFVTWEESSKILTVTESTDNLMSLTYEGTGDLEITNGIALDKLVVHHTFDSDTLFDNAFDDSLYLNSGTFGQNADISVLNQDRNPDDVNGLPSVAGKIGDGAIKKVVEAEFGMGFSENNSKKQWEFLHSDRGGIYSLNMWLNGNWTGLNATGMVPILYDGNSKTGNDGAILVGITNTGEVTLLIESAEQRVIDEQGSGNGFLTDNTWGMITLTINKTKTQQQALFYINTGISESDFDNDFLHQSTIDNKMIIGPSIIFNDFPLLTQTTPETIDFFMDELCIWEDHILSQSEINTLYYSGNGANCKTVSVLNVGTDDVDVEPDTEIPVLEIEIGIITEESIPELLSTDQISEDEPSTPISVLDAKLNSLKQIDLKNIKSWRSEIFKFVQVGELLLDIEKNNIKNIRSEFLASAEETENSDQKALRKTFNQELKESTKLFDELRKQYRAVFEDFIKEVKQITKESNGLTINDKRILQALEKAKIKFYSTEEKLVKESSTKLLISTSIEQSQIKKRTRFCS